MMQRLNHRQQPNSPTRPSSSSFLSSSSSQLHSHDQDHDHENGYNNKHDHVSNSSDSDEWKKNKKISIVHQLSNLFKVHMASTNMNTGTGTSSRTYIMIIAVAITVVTTIVITTTISMMAVVLQNYNHNKSLGMNMNMNMNMNMPITSRHIRERRNQNQLSFPRIVYTHSYYNRNNIQPHRDSRHDDDDDDQLLFHGSSVLPLYNMRDLEDDEMEHNLHQHPRHYIDYVQYQDNEHHERNNNDEDEHEDEDEQEHEHHRQRQHHRQHRHHSNNNSNHNDNENHNDNDNDNHSNHNKNHNHYENKPECKPMHDYSKFALSTCNTIHEQPLLNDYNYDHYHSVSSSASSSASASASASRYTSKSMSANTNHDKEYEYKNQLLANGGFRTTYRIYDEMSYEPIAMKTLKEIDNGRDNHYNDKQLLDNHKTDAIFYEQLSSSTNIIDIYGYCANSGLYEYADGGGIHKMFNHGQEPEGLNQRKRLEIAIDVVSSVADLHTIGSRNGHSAFVHGDMKADQFVLAQNGKFKLNDFNKGHLMYWNTTTITNNENENEYKKDSKSSQSQLQLQSQSQSQSTCTYSYKISNPNKFASPEEYNNGERNEKTDVYSMGNVLYSLLTNEVIFYGIDSDYAKHLLRQGKKPKLSREIRHTDDYVDSALVEALKMCFVYDWRDRPTAAEVRDYLIDTLDNME